MFVTCPIIHLITGERVSNLRRVSFNKGADEHLRPVRLPAVQPSQPRAREWRRASLSLPQSLSLSNSKALFRVSDQLGGNHVFEHYEEQTLPINVKKAPDWNKSVWSSLHHLLKRNTRGCARQSESFVLWHSWSRAAMARELWVVSFSLFSMKLFSFF